MAAIASRLKYTPEPQALPKVTYNPVPDAALPLSMAEPHSQGALNRRCTTSAPCKACGETLIGVLCSRGFSPPCMPR